MWLFITCCAGDTAWHEMIEERNARELWCGDPVWLLPLIPNGLCRDIGCKRWWENRQRMCRHAGVDANAGIVTLLSKSFFFSFFFGTLESQSLALNTRFDSARILLLWCYVKLESSFRSLTAFLVKALTTIIDGSHVHSSRASFEQSSIDLAWLWTCYGLRNSGTPERRAQRRCWLHLVTLTLTRTQWTTIARTTFYSPADTKAPQKTIISVK